MPTENELDVVDYIRIPVVLKDLPRDKQKRIALAVKQAVEKRDGRSRTWAHVVRLAFRALAKELGVSCK